MLLRLVAAHIRRRKGRFAVAVLAVAAGAAAASALMGLSLEVGGRVGAEMRAYGANILLAPNASALRLEVGGVSYGAVPEEDHLNESDLYRIKTIFWRNNIVGFAPYLHSIVETRGQKVVLAGTWFERTLAMPDGSGVRAGALSISPWWRLQGRAPAGEDGALLGAGVAKRLGLRIGDSLDLAYGNSTRSFLVTGIVETGGYEDDQALVDLAAAQGLLGLPGRVERVYVSALVKPEDALSRKPHGEMAPKEHERWYCSPYLSSVLYQLEEALPGAAAKPIRRVSEAEGEFVGRVEGLMLLVTFAALAASGAGVAATLTSSAIERQGEIGLMKAIGAPGRQITAQFLAEAAVIGLAGGALGTGGGVAIAYAISAGVFPSPVLPGPGVLLPVLALSAATALAGSLLPVRRALRVDAVRSLRGGVG